MRNATSMLRIVCFAVAALVAMVSLNIAVGVAEANGNGRDNKMKQMGEDLFAYHAVNSVIDARIGELYSGSTWGTNWYYDYAVSLTGSGVWSEQYSLWYNEQIHRSCTGSGSDFTVEDYFGTGVNDPDNYARTRSGDLTVEMWVTIDERTRNPGDGSFIRIMYRVNNTGTSTQNNMSFFALVDYDIPNTIPPEYTDDTSDYQDKPDMVWIRDDEFIAGFSADEWDRPSYTHGMAHYSTELWSDDGDGYLNDQDNYGPGDPGVGEQWYIGDLGAGEAWAVTVEYWFNRDNITADAGGPYSGFEGSPVNLDASNSWGTGLLEYRWSFDGGSTYGSWSRNPRTTHTWDDDYFGNVCVQVRDNVETDTDCVSASIYNVIPTVNIWADPNPAAEGVLVTFGGNFSDPGTNDTHIATWEFGDGSPPATGGFTPGQGYRDHDMTPITHAYGKQGIYQANLTIQDDDGGLGRDSVEVTITNVAPIVTVRTNTTIIPEGLPFITNGSFYDPSWNDTHTAIWDFGFRDDMTGLGPTHPGGFSPGPGYGNTTHYMDELPWVYGDDGNYTIYLNVTDEFEGFGSASTYIVVENVAPRVINITSILHQNAPRTHGYWKHQCKVKNPNSDHPGIRQEWIDAIRSQSTVFTDVYTKDDVCNYLDPSKPMTPMKRAKMQLMALWLNVVSGLLFIDSPLHDIGAPNQDSVREFIEYAEWLILNDPTDENLTWVATIADHIVSDADSVNDWQVIDPLVGEYLAYVYDMGTDDLMFVWTDSYWTSKTIHYQFNDGFGFEPLYNPAINEVRTPWGTYPFMTVDRHIVGYPPTAGSGTTASLLCLKDDDGGISPDANLDCSDPWGTLLMSLYDTSIEWMFEFVISYREIAFGFIIAEVTADYINWDSLVVTRIEGGFFTF